MPSVMIPASAATACASRPLTPLQAPSSAPAAQATVVADKKVDDPPPYSCGAQLRLPEGQFNVSIGEPPLQDYSLQDLKNLGGSGWDFATYMKAQKGGAGGGALGAKFRNFRREELEMYWDDGTDPGACPLFKEIHCGSIIPTSVGEAMRVGRDYEF